jgi:hypothetical protein
VPFRSDEPGWWSSSVSSRDLGTKHDSEVPKRGFDTMKRNINKILRVMAVLLIAQSVLWIARGRSRLLAATALYDIELSARLVLEQGQPTGRPNDYLMLADEVANSLSKSELDHYREVFSSYAPGEVLTFSEWSQLFESLGPEEQWNLHTAATDCVNVVATINTPFVAKVECSDMCTDIAWSGHEHWFVFVLGRWVHVRVSGSWVS